MNGIGPLIPVEVDLKLPPPVHPRHHVGRDPGVAELTPAALDGLVALGGHNVDLARARPGAVGQRLVGEEDDGWRELRITANPFGCLL